ncbi:hypothetical protein BH23CHL2_BH23CHL2_33110 [soil metagenome]
MMLVEATVDGQRYGGMVEAVINPGKEDWGLLSAGFGEQKEGRPIAGHSGGAGRHYIGLHTPSTRVHASRSSIPMAQSTAPSAKPTIA